MLSPSATLTSDKGPPPSKENEYYNFRISQY
jgi:hypothetical protein